MSALTAAAQPLKLPVAAPFHLEATVRVLQRRPTNPVDIFAQGRYRRVLAIAGRLALVEVENRGTIDAPDLRLSVSATRAPPGLLDQAPRLVRRVLALDSDPTALERLAAAAPQLLPLCRALRGMRPPRFTTLFETCASVLPFQQLSLESGIATLTRLVRRFGRELRHERQHWLAFPSAESVAQAPLPQLRACGFSARKAGALREIARHIAHGQLSEPQLQQLSSADGLRTLQELPGIGPWSAALILLRGLGRTDVFPPNDVAATAGVRKLLQLGPRAQLARSLDRLGTLRGYLYFCALGAALLGRDLIRAAPP